MIAATFHPLIVKSDPHSAVRRSCSPQH